MAMASLSIKYSLMLIVMFSYSDLTFAENQHSSLDGRGNIHADSENGSESNWEERSILSSIGRTKYFVYRPTNANLGIERIVISLHGCKMTARGFAEDSKLVEYSERTNTLIIAPQQESSRNFASCWNWFLPVNQQRTNGEAATLAQIIQFEQTERTLTNTPVYAIGISAGAAMATILNSCYPDIINGSIASAGMQFKAATTLATGLEAMKYGSLLSPLSSAQLASICAGTATFRPMLLIHGAKDGIVSTVNSEQILSQILFAADLKDDSLINNSINRNPVYEEDGRSSKDLSFAKLYELRKYGSQSGPDFTTFAWTVIVDNLEHKWSGGNPGPYMDPKGPNSIRFIDRFINEIETNRLPRKQQ